MAPIALALSFCFAIFAAAKNPHGNAVENRRAHLNRSSHGNLAKRDFSGQATWFVDGLGACGGYNSPGDFIVALNIAQWDGGSHCGETITITGLGKTHTATVTDQCPSCSYGSLDMSQGLFDYYTNPGTGEFSITWNWGGEQEQVQQTTKKPAPTTTHHTTTTTTSQTTTSTTPTTSQQATTTSASSPDGTPSTGDSTQSQGGNIANQQKLVWVLANIATFGKSISSSS